MTLQPYQYQIDDIVFGQNTQIPIQSVDIQTYNVNNQDFQVQRSDENRFGIDTLVPGTLVFKMSVLNNFQLENMIGFSHNPFPTNLFASDNQYLNKLAASWKDIPLRLTWGATKPLLFCDKRGKVVRVYGRPGKFTHTPRNKDGEIWVDVQAEFRRADTFAHSDIEWYVGHATDPTKGLAPGAAAVNAERQDGDGDSWLRVLIYGPATNPVITYGSNVIETNSVIPDGVVAEISSYPWMRRYIDSDDLNRRTEIIGDTLYLDQIRFYAGTNVDVSWTADDTTSASQIYFLWRESYNVI